MDEEQTVITEEEFELVAQLREQPDLNGSVREILAIAKHEGWDANEVEQKLIVALRELGRVTVGTWASEKAGRLEEEMERVEPCLHRHKQKTVKWLCTFGAVEISDCVWRDPGGGLHRPLPERIGVCSRGKSLRLQRALTDFGADESFAKASAKVKEHYGLDVGAGAVRAVTLKHAALAQSRERECGGRAFRALPGDGADTLVCQADGSFLRTVESGLPRKGNRPRQWKEARVVAAQAAGKARAVYAATFGGPEQAGRDWARAARLAGWALNTKIHGLGDGADWIERQLREIFGENAEYLIDYYHLLEYLAAAAGRIAPGKEKNWMRTQKRRLRKGQHKKVVSALKKGLEPESSPDEEAPARCAWRYMTNRPDAFNYHKALEKELPIGSGMIESSHGHILQSRMKQNGMAWTLENAEPMVQLRVLRANDRWPSYWCSQAAA